MTFKIPHVYIKDDYIQRAVLIKFCKNHDIKINSTDNKAELIQLIHDYSNKNKECLKEVVDWVNIVLKEGSKEFCYKKIYNINPALYNKKLLIKLLNEMYPNYEYKNLLKFKSKEDISLVNYSIECDEKDRVRKISMIFSILALEGERGSMGNRTIYPMFIDIYLDKGFIVSRAKAKSTLYFCTDSKLLNKNTHLSTKKLMFKTMNNIIENFNFEIERDFKRENSTISKMLYNLYSKYSFTPNEVKKEVESVSDKSTRFVESIFDELKLSYSNFEDAMDDISIFVEKYISINGDNENIFKEDRDAYLIKIITDDVQEMTKIDTTSPVDKPLQCTEAFFDSKKSVVKSKQCNRLHLCFKRKEKKHFGKLPICVQFNVNKGYGTFKTLYYAEEDDIEHVLQTVFENY